ncbi:heavy-metal-associated domain-containing protein [Chroococcidiopsis sp. TS-821]|uniref:heavy-metal-associated domain-containing protein n=1 Tax=Chroococcidiopsis sp. TS-821 TaxID=1378066 RepID=UPI000CEECE7B|nr:heavy-metal-associated domain-containing protein [Chroococcidiopsis sp. TS-821]PPS41221.1 heavy metal transporter [Chroococcidiopsis sp. TS-821]
MMTLKVPKMACKACVNAITQAIHSVDVTAKVQAEPKTKLVNIETQVSATAIKEALASVGYPAA